MVCMVTVLPVAETATAKVGLSMLEADSAAGLSGREKPMRQADYSKLRADMHLAVVDAIATRDAKILVRSRKREFKKMEDAQEKKQEAQADADDSKPESLAKLSNDVKKA